MMAGRRPVSSLKEQDRTRRVRRIEHELQRERGTVDGISSTASNPREVRRTSFGETLVGTDPNPLYRKPKGASSHALLLNRRMPRTHSVSRCPRSNTMRARRAAGTWSFSRRDAFRRVAHDWIGYTQQGAILEFSVAGLVGIPIRNGWLTCSSRLWIMQCIRVGHKHQLEGQPPKVNADA